MLLLANLCCFNKRSGKREKNTKKQKVEISLFDQRGNYSFYACYNVYNGAFVCHFSSDVLDQLLAGFIMHESYLQNYL